MVVFSVLQVDAGPSASMLKKHALSLQRRLDS
jgi:hypothetical protein